MSSLSSAGSSGGGGSGGGGGGLSLVADEASLARRVAAGDGYECTQLYLGLLGRLRQQGKHDEAENVGLRGARALVAAGQPSNAKHLALKVLESLGDRNAPMANDAANCALVVGLVDAFDTAIEKGKAPHSSSSSSSSGGGGGGGGGGDAADAASDAASTAVAVAAEAAEQKMVVCKEACKLVGPAYAPLHGVRARGLAASGKLAEAAKHFALAGPAAVEPYAALLSKWAVRQSVSQSVHQ
jgi:hypothetical protein